LLPGFVETFQIVLLEELPEKKVYNILDKFADFCNRNLKIAIDKKAIELSYRLLIRYYPYQSFPGKAIRFLGQCVSVAQIAKQQHVGTNEVIANFVKSTGLPELFLRDDMLLEIKALESYFSDKIIGQPVAIRHLTNVVKIFKAGLNNPYKPITTMIFAGPTGVGKTASAKALAEYFFGKGQQRSPLIRIDMSEFQHAGQIARFIGAGREVGKLVQDIRERPFSVLLLDEVEKADPAIFDAFLSVLDEGMLVDAFGRITNFRNTIIIMTTNLGASNRQSIGYGSGMPDEAAYESAIGKYFRPEFVNRIDSIVMFNALKADDIRQITAIELEAVKQREGFVKNNLTLKFTQGVYEYLSKVGFDERYGARPLQRAVEHEIIAPLATWLIENPVENVLLEIDFDEALEVRVF
jgi:ATP-dependent Clp protease ATP-binding subunit ClpA